MWGQYRFVVVSDTSKPDGLASIDLGAGHSSSSESLCGRTISALRSRALLNESVGAGYLERNWPPALKESGAWPLVSLRQSFLDGSLTRLIDPDTVLRRKIVEFVNKGDFGIGSGEQPEGGFARLSFKETVAPEDIMFESNVYLLTSAVAATSKATSAPEPQTPVEPEGDPGKAGSRTPGPEQEPEIAADSVPTTPEPVVKKSVRIEGSIPPESWNRIGTRLLPKLRAGAVSDLKVSVAFELTADSSGSDALLADLRQVLDDLQVADRVRIKAE